MRPTSRRKDGSSPLFFKLLIFLTVYIAQEALKTQLGNFFARMEEGCEQNNGQILGHSAKLIGDCSRVAPIFGSLITEMATNHIPIIEERNDNDPNESNNPQEANSTCLSLQQQQPLTSSKQANTIRLFLKRFASLSTLRLFPVVTVEAVRIVRLEAPHSIQEGQTLKLRCIYENRGDKLQSLSWYKNGREFYRYQPFERRQPVLAFDSIGINVDLTRSKNSTIFLTNTTSETSGRYKCEATGTTFQEVNMETHVNVIAASSSAINLELQMPLLLTYVTIITMLLRYLSNWK